MGSFKVKLVAYFLLLSLLPAGGCLLGLLDGRGAERGPAGRRAPAGRASRDAGRLPGGARLGRRGRRRGSPANPPSSGRSLASRPRRARAHAAGQARARRRRRPGAFASASADPMARHAAGRRRRGRRQPAARVIASVPLDRRPRQPSGGSLRARETRTMSSSSRTAGSWPGLRAFAAASIVRSGKTRHRLRRRDGVPGSGRRHAQGTAQRDARRDQPAGAHRRCQPQGDESAAHRPRRRARLRRLRWPTSKVARSCARSGAWSTPLHAIARGDLKQRVPRSGPRRVRAARPNVQPDGLPAADASRRARGGARAPARRHLALRRGARCDARRRAADAAWS